MIRLGSSDWIGTFEYALNRCDNIICCCPPSKLTIAKHQTNDAKGSMTPVGNCLATGPTDVVITNSMNTPNVTLATLGNFTIVKDIITVVLSLVSMSTRTS